MKNMIANLIKDNMCLDDSIIALSMLSSAKEAADMYLNSTLTSCTPELRAIYSASLIQMVEGHTALTALTIAKGWVKPYDQPINQLSCAYDCAKNSLKEENKG